MRTEPYAEAIPTSIAREPAAPLADAPASESLRVVDPDLSLNRLYYSSDATHPPLRIGVIVNRGDAQHLIIRKTLEDIVRCNFAEIACVIVNCEPPTREGPRGPLPARIASNLFDSRKRSRLLYMAYLRLLDRRRRAQPDPHSEVDCQDLFEGIPRIDVMPIRKGFVHRFSAEDVERVRSLDLDVILRFGFNILRGDILNAARHGVWSYHHGDSERYRGGPSQLWELMESNPLTGAVLQRLDDSLDACAVLHKAILSTCPRPWLSMNRYNVHWSTQHFVIQKLHELHRYGAEHVERQTRQCGVYGGRRKIYRAPDNIDMARWLVPLAFRTVARKVAKHGEISHWRIALRRSPRPLYEDAASVRATDFEWLESPRGRFWADPFLIEEGGETWLFFEDFDRAKRKGAIDCGRLVNGRLTDIRTVLMKPHHLSYPSVFKYDGAVWMVPESEQTRQIQLYRARRFPDDWVLERTLLDLRAVDSSLFQYDGRWWMTTSPVIVSGQAPIMLLFVAPEPWGPWTLHPRGSVCTDVRWARGAGSIIADGDRLIRPSQDCSSGYGYCLWFNEVTLSESTYEERHATRLLPNALGIDGVHTYNRVGEWEAIDGRIPRRL